MPTMERNPYFYQDPVLGKQPHIFARAEAVDGDASPWKEAPVGSIFVSTVAGSLNVYLKRVNNQADADWYAVTIAS